MLQRFLPRSPSRRQRPARRNPTLAEFPAALRQTGEMLVRVAVGREGVSVPAKIGDNEQMHGSTERFLTTHTGSLPRPDDLVRMMFAREEGVPVDPAALATRVRAAVAEVVRRQGEAGLAVV